jgi:RNA 2',3'-cyclic 3'-phosphodiesterase
MRLFFALLPDSQVRHTITTAAHALELGAASALVPPENYHVTLAFVGEVPASQIPALLNIGAAQRSAKFAIRFDAYEYWPTPKVVVVAARECPQSLEGLWQRLQTDLARHDLAPEHQHLRPHVTLARKVSQAPVLQAMSAIGWSAQAFSLMHSNTAGARPIYTVVDTWPLLDEAATP